MIKVQVGTNTDRKETLIDPTTTLRKTLEDNEVNYGAAIVYLDGCTLSPGDLDKTFTDFNITEKAMLTAVIKIADGAKLKTIGRAVVITSELKLEDINKLTKYSKDALVTKEDEQVVFGVSAAASPSISKYGIVFNDEDKDGKARVTIVVPDKVENIKEWVKENYTFTLTRLNALEKDCKQSIENLQGVFKLAEESMSFE